MAPEDGRAEFLYCKALIAAGQYQRTLSEFSVEAVAHGVFHELMELANRSTNKKEMEAMLMRFRSGFATSPGPEALAGGLIEFTRHVHQYAEAGDAPQLRIWSDAISKLFSGDPRFEMVINVFDVMVRYKESRDERVLMELPLEQRQLLESKEAVAQKASVAEGQTSSQ
jgi:hypothetical protein